MKVNCEELTLEFTDSEALTVELDDILTCKLKVDGYTKSSGGKVTVIGHITEVLWVNAKGE